MTGLDLDAIRAPDDVYRLIAADQGARWDYAKTLDQDELAAFIQRQSEDPNLRADADTVWREAQRPLLAAVERVLALADAVERSGPGSVGMWHIAERIRGAVNGTEGGR